RKEIGNREVALSGIVIEGEDAGPFAELRQLLRDTRERGAGGNADQQSFLARGTTRHLFRLVRVDVDDTIEDLSIEDARDEVGAQTLDRVGTRLTAGEDWRQRRLDGEHLKVRPRRFEHFRAGRDVAPRADASDD